MSVEEKIVMPSLGETMEEGLVAEWKKKEGDLIQQGDILLSVETDKTTMDVESFITGKIKKILIQAGETAAVGEAIAIIEKQIG
jgi:pyruvate dehydrogenase E2 component (dihydrolipoamide acetyltransferase)